MREFIDKKLVIASNNSGKIRELKEILKIFKIQILSNENFNIVEPNEDGDTFKKNAFIKSFNTASKTNLVSLSDDSGISFSALNGRPGVYSARYAGEKKNFSLAMKKLNEELKLKDDKSCKFTCALSLCWPDGFNITVQGEVFGEFSWPPCGLNGFGYDPIFYYPKLKKTFGELEPSIKHRISHRNVAFNKLINEIKKIINA
tara:strand:+ start:108 stop:713 length:606 start_codon:yes stop_codon:yes gene_type:complete